MRNLDLAVRFGGDEFVWVLPQTRLDGALIAAERFQNKLSNQLFSTSTEIDITISASLGVTCYQPQETAKSFIDRADTLLRKAKASGRNQVLSSTLASEEILENTELGEQAEHPSIETSIKRSTEKGRGS